MVRRGQGGQEADRGKHSAGVLIHRQALPQTGAWPSWDPQSRRANIAIDAGVEKFDQLKGFKFSRYAMVDTPRTSPGNRRSGPHHRIPRAHGSRRSQVVWAQRQLLRNWIVSPKPTGAGPAGSRFSVSSACGRSSRFNQDTVSIEHTKWVTRTDFSPVDLIEDRGAVVHDDAAIDHALDEARARGPRPPAPSRTRRRCGCASGTG